MTEHMKSKDSKHPDANADPISGAPGAHPVGTAAGAASGAAAGAAVGAVVGGPIGFAAGGAVGAVVGGLGGKAMAEAVNPTAEDAYWRENYAARPYAVGALSYDMYQPAYRTGWEARSAHADRDWNELEPELQTEWNRTRAKGSLEWSAARPAAQDAWEHARLGSEGGTDSGYNSGANR